VRAEVGQEGEVAVAERARPEEFGQFVQARVRVGPGGQTVPDGAEALELRFVPEGAVVHEGVGRGFVVAREEQAARREDGAERVEVVGVDGFPGFGRVGGEVAGEGEVAGAPFLGDFGPVFSGLGLRLVGAADTVVDDAMRTISEAIIRMRLAMDAAGELSASLVSFHSASVTVVRQSTHVPNTSKNRQRGWGSRNAMSEVLTGVSAPIAVRCWKVWLLSGRGSGVGESKEWVWMFSREGVCLSLMDVIFVELRVGYVYYYSSAKLGAADSCAS